MMGLVLESDQKSRPFPWTSLESAPPPFVRKTQREEEDGSEKTKPQVLLLLLSKSLYFTSRQKKARDDDALSSKTVGTVGGAVKRDLLSTPFLLKRAFDATERAFVKLETKRRSSKHVFFLCAPLKFSRRTRRPPFSRFRFEVATTGSLSLSLKRCQSSRRRRRETPRAM